MKLNNFLQTIKPVKIIEFFYHALFWGSICFFFIHSSVVRPLASSWQEFISVCFIVFVCYLNYFLLYPTFFKRKKKFHFVYFFLLIILILAISVLELLLVLSNTRSCYHLLDDDTFQLVIRQIILLIFLRDSAFICFSLFYTLYGDAYKFHLLTQEKCRMDLEIQELNTATRFWANSFHEICNTLESVPKDAADKIMAISNLQQTILNQKPLISITEEIKVIENLLLLRNDRRYIDLDIHFSCKDVINPSQKIAPFLLESFINNAFEYVKTDGGYIRVSLRNNKDKIICFECENNIEGESPDITSSKSGIRNAIRRLDLIYPEKYDFRIVETANTFKISLRIEDIENRDLQDLL